MRIIDLITLPFKQARAKRRARIRSKYWTSVHVDAQSALNALKGSGLTEVHDEDSDPFVDIPPAVLIENNLKLVVEYSQGLAEDEPIIQTLKSVKSERVFVVSPHEARQQIAYAVARVDAIYREHPDLGIPAEVVFTLPPAPAGKSRRI